MIASEIARQIIIDNTGKEPNDWQIVRAEMLIVAFANEYHKALTPKSSTECAMPDVGQSFYCHRKKWLKEEGCRWQCNECINDAEKYGESLPLAEMTQKVNNLTKEETKEELEKWFKYKRQC